MQTAIKWIIVVILALLLPRFPPPGFSNLQYHPFIETGQWQTSLNNGSPNADMYTRAFTAVYLLFALNKSEALYFHTTVDNDGRELTSDCDYVIRGVNLNCRWWSITAYGTDRFLIPNTYHKYSKSIKNTKYNRDGTFTIKISSEFRDGNWIPIGKKGNFRLAMRLYNPAQTVYDTIGSIALPKVYRENCR